MTPAQIIQLIIIAQALLQEGNALLDTIMEASNMPIVSDADMERILSNYEASAKSRQESIKKLREANRPND